MQQVHDLLEKETGGSTEPPVIDMIANTGKNPKTNACSREEQRCGKALLSIFVVFFLVDAVFFGRRKSCKANMILLSPTFYGFSVSSGCTDFIVGAN
jgi:hypothetical protein